MRPPDFTGSGIVLVDKPGGITSHDVVAEARRAMGTKRVGHAGTLDPLATGLLVLGVNGATRLLTFLVGLDKTYHATIRLGVSTSTDDAEGESLGKASQEQLARVTDEAILAAVAALTGAISQVPSSVSAIKVAGKRAYARVRQGENVSLPAREVTVSRFDVVAIHRKPDHVDVEVVVDCSSGTYIRALARDMGFRLGVGGHLTALRRTRVGPFSLASAFPAGDLGDRPVTLLDPADVAAQLFPVWRLTPTEAQDLRHGRTRTLVGPVAGRLAAIDDAGRLVGIVDVADGNVAVAFNMPQE